MPVALAVMVGELVLMAAVAAALLLEEAAASAFAVHLFAARARCREGRPRALPIPPLPWAHNMTE